MVHEHLIECSLHTQHLCITAGDTQTLNDRCIVTDAMILIQWIRSFWNACSNWLMRRPSSLTLAITSSARPCLAASDGAHPHIIGRIRHPKSTETSSSPSVPHHSRRPRAPHAVSSPASMLVAARTNDTHLLPFICTRWTTAQSGVLVADAAGNATPRTPLDRCDGSPNAVTPTRTGSHTQPLR